MSKAEVFAAITRASEDELKAFIRQYLDCNTALALSLLKAVGDNTASEGKRNMLYIMLMTAFEDAERTLLVALGVDETSQATV